MLTLSASSSILISPCQKNLSSRMDICPPFCRNTFLAVDAVVNGVALASRVQFEDDGEFRYGGEAVRPSVVVSLIDFRTAVNLKQIWKWSWVCGFLLVRNIFESQDGRVYLGRPSPQLNTRELDSSVARLQTGATGKMKQGVYWVVVMLGVGVLADTLAVHRPSYAARVKAQYPRGRRSDLDNAINALPEQERHDLPHGSDPNIGDQLMEEFLTFLTLKETGLLDMCLHMKR
ncbi:uncharacterized protein [Haliotis asinina]|uniref:uncharacterized protein n=1 Tax=Haliotis asinina TaxID=109174 RepID=UPI0035326E72